MRLEDPPNLPSAPSAKELVEDLGDFDWLRDEDEDSREEPFDWLKVEDNGEQGRIEDFDWLKVEEEGEDGREEALD